MYYSVILLLMCAVSIHRNVICLYTYKKICFVVKCIVVSVGFLISCAVACQVDSHEYKQCIHSVYVCTWTLSSSDWYYCDMMAGNMERFVSEGKGNGLRALSEIKAGEVIHSCEPYAFCIAKDFLKTACQSCLKR